MWGRGGTTKAYDCVQGVGRGQKIRKIGRTYYVHDPLQYLRYGDIVIFVKCKLQQLLNEEEFQHNFFKLVIFLRHYTIKELPKLPSPSFNINICM